VTAGLHPVAMGDMSPAGTEDVITCNGAGGAVDAVVDTGEVQSSEESGGVSK